MFSQTPDLYDLIYSSFKDYEAEVDQICDLLASRASNAKTILDVACGTGEHSWRLARRGYSVDGLDIEPAFVESAGRKLPGATFECADMADFAFDRTYDVVLCLFSSIGYLCELDRVESALRCFRRHLGPGGIAVVEPWIEPDAWYPGSTHLVTAKSDSMKVARLSRSDREGAVSVIEFQYLVATSDGIEHREETHRLGLFTRREMLACFEAAGFARVDFDEEGLIGRGMYVATRGD